MLPDSLASPDSMTASMAQTADAYDAVPYLSMPFPHLHPSRIAAIARVLGLSPRPVATSRILEIGCATGGHLIAIAANYPQADLVGIDISPRQIELGQERIKRLGLANIALQARSLTELGEGDGQFDFIICHGVYSWIPEALRSELMRVVGERLAPTGLAAISFNVLPGWRLFQVVRDSMLLHAGASSSHEERSALTRQLFELMGKHSEESTAYGQVWRTEAPRMSALPDFYLAHELFEDNNLPCTFSDFMGMAQRQGLAYLAEARFAANVPENHGPELGALARAFGQNDMIRTEQYTDIVSGRTFRESLLIRSELAGQVDRQLETERLADLHVSIDESARVVEEEDGTVLLSIRSAEIEVHDRPLAGALRQVLARRPETTGLADLVPDPAWGENWRDRYLALILRLFSANCVELHADPVRCTVRPSSHPKAIPLAIQDALAKEAKTTTLLHVSYELTPFGRFLIPLLDGSRSQQMLLDEVVRQTIEGGAPISDDSGPVTDPARVREICRNLFERKLQSLALAALLVA